jgi:sulfide dehydrogenase cytochrome subunit
MIHWSMQIPSSYERDVPQTSIHPKTSVMKKIPRCLGILLTTLVISAGMQSCSKDYFTDPGLPTSVEKDKGTSITASTMDLPGRTLAANCFQCHGTNGVAGELKIAGESASEIIGELNEMRAKDPRSNIMNVHALAYTTDEIKLIADYFSKQTN